MLIGHRKVNVRDEVRAASSTILTKKGRFTSWSLALKITGEKWVKKMTSTSSWSLCLSFYCSWTTSRRTLVGWLVNTTRQCCTAQWRVNHRVLQISLLQTSFCGTSSSHRALANPAELRALFTRVYHRTWTGSRWIVEKNGQCTGPQAKGLRCRQRRFLSSSTER